MSLHDSYHMSNAAGQKSSICIVGVGAVTSVGLSAPATAAAVRGGISGFAEHPFMIDRQGEPIIVASVLNIGATTSGPNHLCDLTARALREAALPLEPHCCDAGRIATFVGLPPQRPGRAADLESRLVDALRQIAGISSVECIATGHSAGLMALEAVSRNVVANPTGLYLAGGVDSYLEPETMDWLEGNDQLHGGPNAFGFMPGEAAGFCLVCSEQVAQRFDLPVLARLWTGATAREENLIKTDTVCLGKGLTEVFRKVFAQLPATTERIDHIICDMNGEPYRADEYGFSIARLSQRFEDASAFIAPADCWGDVGAASGPLFVNLVVAAGQRGYAKARYNLVWTSSESGERSAAILQNELSVRN